MWTLTSLTRFAPRLPTFAPAVRLSCAFAGWDFSPTKSAPASCGPESKHRQTWRRLPPIWTRGSKNWEFRAKHRNSRRITLARFDPPGISENLRAAALENATREFGAVRTGEFHLFESKTRPTGAEYTRLSSFSFAKAEA